MPPGNTPGPTGAPDKAIKIDAGTLVRTKSSIPGPIGLQAKQGTAKTTSVSVGEQIVAYARANLGQSVGDGQCFALADQALRNAGAKSAADFAPHHRVGPHDDYEWGTRVRHVSELQPGDIIQFRSYRFERKTTEADGSWAEQSGSRGAPNHTAIVEHVDGQGAVTVLEQNVNGGPVQEHQLFFSNVDMRSGGTHTTITVHGRSWFYRPQHRRSH
jgi:CHAP domain